MLLIFLTLDRGGVGISVSISPRSFHPDSNREELAGAATSSKEEAITVRTKGMDKIVSKTALISS